MFNAILIPADSSDEATIVNIIESLKQFENGADTIFQRAKERLSNCQQRLHSYGNRTMILEQKVEYLRTCSDVPMLFSMAKYPETGERGMHEVVFEELTTSTPFHIHNVGDIFPESFGQNSGISSTSIAVTESMARKTGYDYVFAMPKFMEANIDYGLDSDDYEDLSMFAPSTSESNVRHVQKKISTNDSNLLRESLLSHCEFESNTIADPFTYRPEVAHINTFDFPSVLPDLPGGTNKVTFDDADDSFFEPISLSTTFSARNHKLSSSASFKSDIDLSASSSFYMPMERSKISSGECAGLSARDILVTVDSFSPRHSELSQSFQNDMSPGMSASKPNSNLDVIFAENGNSNFNATAINGDFGPLTIKESTNVKAERHTRLDSQQLSLHASKTIQDIPEKLSCPAVPPPPPPPPSYLLKNDSSPAKLPIDVTKGHLDLMEAIRAAGGMKKARLKKITDHESDSKKQNVATKSTKLSENAGDDLMSSLAKALEIRRRGIAGKSSSNKFVAFENKNLKNKTVSGDVVGAFSRLRQIIPVPNGSSKNASSTTADGAENSSDQEEWS